MALIREGLSNPDIASRLDITREGAKYHVSEILSKLGVTSREEAARWEPSERPWWTTAAVPMAWLWRRASVSWLPTALAGAMGAAVLLGFALLVWGLVRTNGDAAESSGDTSLQVEPTRAIGSATVSLTTPTLATEPASPQPRALSTTTAKPILSPPPTQSSSDCATRTHSHLNIDKLRDQPGLADADITEIDDDSIRIVFEGVEVIVSGVGSSLLIRTNLSNDRLAPLTRAIDAVADEC